MRISDMDDQLDNYLRIDIDEIQLLKSLGKGSFGVVHKARWKDKIAAVKKVESESEVRALEVEVRQLSRVEHENIIHMYGACLDGMIKYLVMEYADGGSLYYLLHNSPNTKYNIKHGICWLLQCAKAVAYLHAIQPRAIIHRDLKTPNLLLMKGAKVLKVCDFGTACDLQTKMTNNKGSVAWMAPEVFTSNSYNEKCDVYSWGIILWEVITRLVPFEELGIACRIMWAVYQQHRPPLIRGCPKPLEELMKSCWDHDPNVRPSMEEVVKKVDILSEFLNSDEEDISYPPSDESLTDSCMSPYDDGSSVGRTSQDFSDIRTTEATVDITLDPKSQPNNNIRTPQFNTTEDTGSIWESDREKSPFRFPKPAHPSQMVISSNVSKNVVVGGELTLSPGSTGHSSFGDGEVREFHPPPDYTKPITITIPNAEPPPRDDIMIVPSAGSHYMKGGGTSPKPSSPSIALTPADMTQPISHHGGFYMRQHLNPQDSTAAVKRRSAEVTPQQFHHREVSHRSHRRSSSYGCSSGLKEDADPGSGVVGAIGAAAAAAAGGGGGGDQVMLGPASHHASNVHNIPQYQIEKYANLPKPSSQKKEMKKKQRREGQDSDPQRRSDADPSFRQPGGSMGGVEGGIRFQEWPARPCSPVAPRPTSPAAPRQSSPAASAAPSRQPVGKMVVPALAPTHRPPTSYAGPNGEDTGGGGGRRGGGGSVGVGVGGGESIQGYDEKGSSDADDAELGAFWEVLDTEISPIMPNTGNQESQRIFNEHKEMAKKYLVVQEEIWSLRQKKKELADKLSQLEKKEQLDNQRYEDKLRQLENKRELLKSTHCRLRQQLERIRAQQNLQDGDVLGGENAHSLTPL